MKECVTLGIKQIFISFNNPKGNADTERMMRAMKEELIWSNEFESLEKLSLALNAWFEDYNASYLYSTLGCVLPNVFEKQCLDQHLNSPLMAA